MELPTTVLADILRQKRFHLHRVNGSSLPKVRADLASRISRGEKWKVAIIQGSDAEDGGGMVLLREGPTPGTFEGVFYRAANCGADRQNVKTTAIMLYMLGVVSSSEAFHDGFLRHYPKVGVTGIGTPHPEYAPIH